MPIVRHAVRLSSAKRFGHRVPPAPLGVALQQVDVAVRRSVLMAFEGRSVAAGRPRAWFNAACDIRLVDVEGNDDATLHFEAPELGEAAEELYLQAEIWPSRPPPGWTGFDVLAGVLQDVGAGNPDSERFDRPLLQRVAHFGRLLEAGFDALRVEEHRTGAPGEAVLDRATVEAARQLRASTPRPRAVVIAGLLDMIRASTQSFSIKLDEGEEIRGVLTAGSAEAAGVLLNRRVLVHGRAVYRPSGSILRLDADRIDDGEGAPGFWSKVPKPLFGGRIDQRALYIPQTATTGINAIFGRWPGDETDEQFDQAIKELS
ncbi:hypothetical protein BE20_14010 [Sorangium cellulosum]|uniref:Uncharacterized protein n=1 Tax=Sorangium cellulosum TaxID=56 RepID=A0A150SH22_SORCE|nr:hypothetical protein BE18_08415 [Sorangium cellulosum]KYF91691.1 hypothetical protein BE20_14010 [Sorangium cellulosum]